MAERDLTPEEEALLDANAERDATDEELAALDEAASAPINVPMVDETTRSSTPYGPEPKPNPRANWIGKDWAGAFLSAFGLAPPPPGLQPRPPPSQEAMGPMVALANGETRNFMDEFVGARAQTMYDMKHILGSVPADPAQITYNQARDEVRNIANQYREEHPVASFGLNVLGGAATAPFTSTPAVVADGVLSGMGSSQNMDEDMLYRGALGGTLAYAGKQAGDILGMFAGAGLNNLSQRAGARVSAAEAKALEMSAEKEAAKIASAKGKLGALTQEANRAVENLLRLESTGGLTGEQQALLATLRQNGTLPALQQKLADAMLEQVPGAAGRVDIARSTMEGLVERQPQAISEGAEAVLSGAEAKRQIGERLRRYLPTIAGSMMGAGAGAGTGLVLGGSPTEALIGGLAGAGIRPALRAGQRMLGHPAVQRGMYAPLETAAATGADVASSIAPRIGMAVGKQPSVSQWLEEAVRSRPDSLGPYSAQLQQAAANGNLALAHWSLQQKDPQYRATIEAARKEQQ